jgi:hypothetical protein
VVSAGKAELAAQLRHGGRHMVDTGDVKALDARRINVPPGVGEILMLQSKSCRGFASWTLALIEALEADRLPWRRPWRATVKGSGKAGHVAVEGAYEDVFRTARQQGHPGDRR